MFTSVGGKRKTGEGSKKGRIPGALNVSGTLAIPRLFSRVTSSGHKSFPYFVMNANLPLKRRRHTQRPLEKSNCDCSPQLEKL